MAAIHETAYPRFKPYFTAKELDEVFALSSDEIALLNRKTKARNTVSRLGSAILLKCYQYLGRPIKTCHINVGIKKYIAKQLSVDPDIDLTAYPKSTFKKHKKSVHDYLEIVQNSKKRREIMKKSALASAQTKENLADIINCIIEEMLRQRCELPAYQALVRLSRAARTVTNNGHYRRISAELSQTQKQLIDHILELNDNKTEDEWAWSDLKQEPKSPTSNNIRKFIDYINRLKQLREKLFVNVDFISPARLKHLRDEAMITDQADQTNALILSFYQTLLIIDKDNTPKEKIDEVEIQFGNKISELLEDFRKHLGLSGDKHFSWVLKPYSNKRSLLFSLLENLNIFSTSEDKSIEKALCFIKHHRSSHKDWIEITDHDEISVDLSLLSQQWFKLVTGLKKGEPVNKIHKHYYEIAVLHTLM